METPRHKSLDVAELNREARHLAVLWAAGEQEAYERLLHELQPRCTMSQWEALVYTIREARDWVASARDSRHHGRPVVWDLGV